MATDKASGFSLQCLCFANTLTQSVLITAVASHPISVPRGLLNTYSTTKLRNNSRVNSAHVNWVPIESKLYVLRLGIEKTIYRNEE